MDRPYSLKNRKNLRPLPSYVPVSPLQLRIAREILGLDYRQQQEAMNAYGVDGSHMIFWRGSQDSSGNRELQEEMRLVFEALGLIFYEREGVGFHEEIAPSEDQMKWRKLPAPIEKSFKRMSRKRGKNKKDSIVDGTTA